MLIDTRYRKGVGWEVNENDALLIYEFRRVLEAKGMGTPAIAFVALYSDPSAPIYGEIENDKERHKKCLSAVFGEKPPKWIDHEDIKEAIAEYKRLTDTTDNKIRKSYKKGALKISKFIDDEDISTSAGAKNYAAVLSEMPSIITNLDKIKEDTRRDAVNKIGKVRGQKELTYAEKKTRVAKDV